MSVEAIVDPAAARTAAVAAGRHVLVVQDTTAINFAGKAGHKRDLGHVGNGKAVGLFLHPAVEAEDGSVLGLAGATIWRRMRVRQDQDQSLSIEEKETNHRLEAPLAARAFLGGTSLVTVVADREAHIYDVFSRPPDERTPVLIRATRDRALVEKGGRLLTTIAAEKPVEGHLTSELAGRTARTVEREVRFCTVGPTVISDNRRRLRMRAAAHAARRR